MRAPVHQTCFREYRFHKNTRLQVTWHLTNCNPYTFKLWKAGFGNSSRASSCWFWFWKWCFPAWNRWWIGMSWRAVGKQMIFNPISLNIIGIIRFYLLRNWIAQWLFDGLDYWRSSWRVEHSFFDFRSCGTDIYEYYNGWKDVGVRTSCILIARAINLLMASDLVDGFVYLYKINLGWVLDTLPAISDAEHTSARSDSKHSSSILCIILSPVDIEIMDCRKNPYTATYQLQ